MSYLKKRAEKFFSSVNELYSNFYNYDKSNYINSSTKITIICPVHGKFTKRPRDHLHNKQGCPKCKLPCVSKRQTDFICQSKLVHNNFYKYNLVKYVNIKTKVKIVCPIHGVFKQEPLNHLHHKQGCPKCKKIVSRGEKEVLAFIKTFYNGEIIENDRKLIKPKEIDLYLPELKIAIEYNGEYWHKKRETEQPGYHLNKKIACAELQVLLIEITDIEWTKNNNLSKKLIKTIIENKTEHLK